MYKFSEDYNAGLLLFIAIANMAVAFQETRHFEFIIFNPIIYLLLGGIVFARKKVSITNNDFSYFLVKGKSAKEFGIALILLGLLSFIILNTFRQYYPAHLMIMLFAQFLTFIFISIIASSKAGRR